MDEEKEVTEKSPDVKTGEEGTLAAGGEISPAAPAVEEIDTTPKPVAANAIKSHAKPVTAHKREEPPPNPLLLDPYEWDRCTITIGYSLLPDGTVSVSVHNHKDEPIVKAFPAADVPLPEKISNVMTSLQTIWPASPVNATVVLLPKQNEAAERSIIVSVRVSTDTPIIQEGVESNLPLPTPILAMLDELKTLIPERGLKNIEKKARTKGAAVARPPAKPAAPVVAAGIKNIRKDQMTLF
ncbi:MAG: hypothetical protein ACM3XO_21865 [Bacteroidota bacterium]